MLTRAFSYSRYSLPNRYAAPAFPGHYSVPGGTRAHVLITIGSDDPTYYDGKTFSLKAPLSSDPGDIVTQIFTFDDDAVPPTTGATINIGGLSTEATIAAQIALAINLTEVSGAPRWTAVVDGVTIYVEQIFPGNAGNLVFVIGPDLGSAFVVNDAADFLTQAPYFYGGADFGLPARLGPGLALMPGATSNVQSVTVGP